MQCGQRYAGLPLRLYTDHWSVALQNICIQTIGLLQTVCIQTILHLWSVLGPNTIGSICTLYKLAGP